MASYLKWCRLRRWGMSALCVVLPSTPLLFLVVRSRLGGAIRFHSGWTALSAFGTIAAVMLLLRMAVWVSERQLRARLRQQDYRVCTQCGYTLNPEHDHQPCPECGVLVDLAAIQHAWGEFLRGRGHRGPS